MGHKMPRARMLAAMRGVKAEGGWSVVCTEEVEIHHSGDIGYAEGRLWDDRDIPALAMMAEAVHEHGALAGIEPVHNGHHSTGRYSREVPLGPSDLVSDNYDPVQARAMDKSDIRAMRRWYRDAALRSKRAGFDIVYIYAGHGLALPMHFLSRRHNRRTDEYGGSLENRARLFRELIEEAKDAVGDTCAVAVRFAVDELLGPDGITAEGEGREVVEMLAELPDLWDVNVSDWPNDSATSRFGPEGEQEPYVAFVKQVTSKPVVGVGRFTSPDAMVSQIRRGILDMIGAARPSIADPFLPRKIEEGRPEDIRECIGCNICVSGDHLMVPIRCTQNPTMGEEWRKGWHPEVITPKVSDTTVLVVGAGPAGLEAARALAARDYQVVLAEAGEELGGRVSLESRLPGLAAWGRVRDYRVGQLERLTNVEIYRASRLDAEQVREFGFPHVVIATGARWRKDGLGRAHFKPVPGSDGDQVVTPDDIMAGAAPGGEGPVLVFDDDHYYMASVIAEKLVAEGRAVTFVTPAADVAHWTHNTMEQERIQRRLLELGVTIHAHRSLTAIHAETAELSCTFTGRSETVPAGGIVMVTAREPLDACYRDLIAEPEALTAAGIETVARLGDCEAPSTIAAAVYAGHRFAQEFQTVVEDADAVPFRRELPEGYT